MSLTAFSGPSLQAAYLRTLPAIRERCSTVHAMAQRGKLEYFDYSPDHESSVVNYCLEIMKVLPRVDFQSLLMADTCFRGTFPQLMAVLTLRL
jgi:hypothetical protein